MQKENLLKKHAITVISFIGIITTIILTYLYFRANFSEVASNSFCTVNSYINCDKVEKSSYSVLLGLPLSVFGFAFYSFVLFVEKVMPEVKFLKEFKNYRSYIFCASVFAIFTSFYLAYISFFEIHALCILCSFTYLLNFLIFGFSKSDISFKTHFRNCINDMKKILFDKYKLGISIVLTLISFVVLAYTNYSGIFINKQNEDISVVSAAEIKKNITIDVYTDFECPFCQIAHLYFLHLQQNYPNVKVVHHDFPLTNKCNKYIKGDFHKNSCNAIAYAKLAKKQGKFSQFSTLLFLNQDNLSSKKLDELAIKAGIDIDKLKSDLKDKAFKDKVAKEIAEDVERAHSLGITGTPTYFIGIKKYEGVNSYQELVQNIQKAQN